MNDIQFSRSTSQKSKKIVGIKLWELCSRLYTYDMTDVKYSRKPGNKKSEGFGHRLLAHNYFSSP
jgi:hypothetical protein